jgi:hypothetical protein
MEEGQRSDGVMEGTPRPYYSALLRPISIAHLGEPLLVANGDSLVNDYVSNEGYTVDTPRKKGRAIRRKRARLSSIPGSFFNSKIATHFEPWEKRA